MLEIFKYIILGLVQGVSEILPISSSAHLLICQEFFLMNDENLFFEILLHLGSFTAIIFFLRKKIKLLIVNSFLYVFNKREDNSEFKCLLCLIISTIPIVLFTLLFGDYIEKVAGNLTLVGFLMMINGLMIFIFTRLDTNKKCIGYKEATIIGLFQMIGTFPGISRSGSCICGGYISKVDKSTSKEYAFLMFIPVMIGAICRELTTNVEIDLVLIPNYTISFIVTTITTYLSIRYLNKIINKDKMYYFGIYTVIVGGLVVLFL